MKSIIEGKQKNIEQCVQKVLEKYENTLGVEEIKRALKKRHLILQDNFQKLQEDSIEQIDNVDSEFETKVLAMEDFVKKQTGETSMENILTELLQLKNQLIFKMDHIQQHQITHSKFYQKTLKTDSQHIEENKKAVNTIKDLVRNMSKLSTKSNKILADHLKHPGWSCQQLTNLAGKYLFSLRANSKPSEFFCEQNKIFGDWTVIQLSFDGSVDFYRNWVEYRNGFVNVNGESWLGLEYVPQIMKNQPPEMIVEIKYFHGNFGYAKYGEFAIGSESEKYKLKKLSSFSTYHCSADS